MSPDSFPEDFHPYDYEDPSDEPQSYSTHIVARRFYVLIEVFMLMLLNFLFLIAYEFLFRDLIDPYIVGNPYEGLINFSVSLVSVIFSTILALGFVQLVFYKSKLPLAKANPPLKETASLFTFKKFGTQILFSVLLLFFVYIPIDFLTYALPNGLDYSLRSLLPPEEIPPNPVNAYLNFSNLGMFLLFSVVLHIMVGIREETYFRGYFAIRAEKYVNPASSVVISSIYFGMSHFTYLIYSQNANIWLDVPNAIVWSIAAFYVGSVSAVFLFKQRNIWPIIIAHALNNIVSSSALWLYNTHGLAFWDLAKWMYFPLIGVSIILGVIFFREIKNGVKSYFDTFRTYKNTFSDTRLRAKIIIADICFGIVFWVVGFTFI